MITRIYYDSPMFEIGSLKRQVLLISIKFKCQNFWPLLSIEFVKAAHTPSLLMPYHAPNFLDTNFLLPHLSQYWWPSLIHSTWEVSWLHSNCYTSFLNWSPWHWFLQSISIYYSVSIHLLTTFFLNVFKTFAIRPTCFNNICIWMPLGGPALSSSLCSLLPYTAGTSHLYLSC